MKLFKWASDGGQDSGVTGLFVVEVKSLFSVVLLRFAPGTREAYHSHAFNAWTLWLKGRVREHDVRGGEPKEFGAGQLKWTPRNKVHMVEALETTWALSVRGPWSDTWFEVRGDKVVELTHGRRIVSEKGI